MGVFRNTKIQVLFQRGVPDTDGGRDLVGAAHRHALELPLGQTLRGSTALRLGPQLGHPPSFQGYRQHLCAGAVTFDLMVNGHVANGYLGTTVTRSLLGSTPGSWMQRLLVVELGITYPTVAQDGPASCCGVGSTAV